MSLGGGGDGAVHLGAPRRVGDDAEQVPELRGTQRRILVLEGVGERGGRTVQFTVYGLQ